MSAQAITRSQSMPDLNFHQLPREGKLGVNTVKEETANPSTAMLSIGAAAAGAFSWASAKGIGATAATHTLGAVSYAQMAPTGVYAQYAAANATHAAASAMVAGTSLGVAANCAVGALAAGTVLGIGILGYNTLIAKTPEEQISFSGMARYAYNKVFG